MPDRTKCNSATPVVALVLASMLAGCANSFSERRADAAGESRRLVAEAIETRADMRPVLTERPDDPIRVRAVVATPESGEVSVAAAGVPFGALLTNLARDHQYSVLFMDGVQVNRPVTVNLRDLTAEAAMRRLALAAGFALVVDRTGRTVAVTDIASYTFRLPLHVMQRLVAQYSVGGSPTVQGGGGAASLSGGGAGAAGGAGGGAAGGAGQGTPSAASGLQAQFTVTGRFQTDAGGLTQFLRDLAGANAEVQVMQEMGFITVRSNGAALGRVSQFLNRFSAVAMRRVDIEASIVEVTLTDEFRYGIDWTRVLSGSTSGSVSLLGTSAITVPGFSPAASANVTRGSISVVLSALQQYTNVRVISQPRVLAMNNTPSVIFDGQQLPYVPTVASTIVAGAGGGTTTTSAAAAFAVDGVTLSLQPDILSDQEVQLTIVPVLNRVQEFQSFEIGSGTRVTAPVQRTNQSLMQVVAQSGNTLILGGIRSSVGDETRGGVPGLIDIPVVGDALNRRNQRTVAREVVLLLRATVIPGGAYDALFSEAL
ncbi:MAG: type II secretion system protein GspD [bacterium]